MCSSQIQDKSNNNLLHYLDSWISTGHLKDENENEQ